VNFVPRPGMVWGQGIADRYVKAVKKQLLDIEVRANE
jgi:hypothetical protein